MKQFVISTVLIIAIIILWYFVFISSLSNIRPTIKILDKEVLPSVEAEHFDEALIKLREAEKEIDSALHTASYFVDSDILLDIRQTLIRAEEFIKAKDASNSSGEIAALSKSLHFIAQSQKPTFNNIL